jgi:hypothetical protein
VPWEASRRTAQGPVDPRGISSSFCRKLLSTAVRMGAHICTCTHVHTCRTAYLGVATVVVSHLGDGAYRGHIEGHLFFMSR